MDSVDSIQLMYNYVDVKMAAVYSRKDLWETYHGGSRIYLQYYNGRFLSIVT